MNKQNILSVQAYNWFIITYLNEEDLHNILESKLDKGIITNYAYINHDRDVTKEGELKKAHRHCIILCKSPVLGSRIQNWFKGINDEGGESNTFVEKLKSKKEGFAYLTHENNPEKYQYSREDVICSDDDYFDSLEDKKTDKSWSALEDLLNGMSYRECARKYGRDFILHYNAYRTLVFDIQQQERLNETYKKENNYDCNN